MKSCVFTSLTSEVAGFVACRCGLAHRLDDEDVVQIVKKKVKTGKLKTQVGGSWSCPCFIFRFNHTPHYGPL